MDRINLGWIKATIARCLKLYSDGSYSESDSVFSELIGYQKAINDLCPDISMIIEEVDDGNGWSIPSRVKLIEHKEVVIE